MPITQTEFETILEDPSKRVEGDLRWRNDDDHSPAVEFRAEVRSDAGYPRWLNARIDRVAGTLSFTLIHRGTGRIYALDLGAAHHNPTCETIGEVHKHIWRTETSDKFAYVPPDITASIDDPVAVWRQFCTEAKIRHKGRLEVPVVQTERFP